MHKVTCRLAAVKLIVLLASLQPFQHASPSLFFWFLGTLTGKRLDDVKFVVWLIRVCTMLYIRGVTRSSIVYIGYQVTCMWLQPERFDYNIGTSLINWPSSL